jgi:hypothetical protein
VAEDPADLHTQLEAFPTDELVSILRNHDEGEWRPEVFGVVAKILEARGLRPAEVAALGPEDLEDHEAVETAPLVTVETFFSPAEAHGARMALEAAGLSAWVTDETLGTAYGVGVGSRLQVRERDLAAAVEILGSPAAPADTLPPELSEPACPACGSRNVTSEAWVQDQGSPQDAEERPFGMMWRKWYGVCADCREAWPLTDEKPRSR